MYVLVSHREDEGLDVRFFAKYTEAQDALVDKFCEWLDESGYSFDDEDPQNDDYWYASDYATVWNDVYGVGRLEIHKVPAE